MPQVNFSQANNRHNIKLLLKSHIPLRLHVPKTIQSHISSFSQLQYYALPDLHFNHLRISILPQRCNSGVYFLFLLFFFYLHIDCHIASFCLQVITLFSCWMPFLLQPINLSRLGTATEGPKVAVMGIKPNLIKSLQTF